VIKNVYYNILWLHCIITNLHSPAICCQDYINFCILSKLPSIVYQLPSRYFYFGLILI